VRAGWRAWALLGLGLLGCSVLVDGDLPQVRCEAEGVVGPPACPAGSTCERGLCAVVTSTADRLGARCVDDSDCGTDGLCRAAGPDEASRVCSRPCCASTECGPPKLGLVCAAIASPGAGRFCVPGAVIGRAKVGPSASGAVCDSDGACRSGWCEAGRCADACCSDTNCAAASAEATCRLGPSGAEPGAKEGWVCRAPPSGELADYLGSCGSDADCGSGLCVSIAGSLRCSKPCCESSACGAVPEGLIACGDVPHGGALVRACAPMLPLTALGAIGTHCTADEQCRGGLCGESGGERLCSDRCCTDAHCADRAFACLPAPDDPTSALRCERK
jgi:hypothetical protein